MTMRRTAAGFVAAMAAVSLAGNALAQTPKKGGTLQFADIANGRPVPIEAVRDVDLWTG